MIEPDDASAVLDVASTGSRRSARTGFVLAQAARSGPSLGIGSARRAAIGSSPGTEKGRRMRNQLLAAAREVFERDGYLNARVADIAAAAGASHGSFYTYFESKTEIFRCLIGEEMERLYTVLGSGPQTATLERGVTEPGSPRRSLEEIIASIDGSNRLFIVMYQQNTALMALFEQVTSIDPEVRALRMQVRRRMVDRAAANIRRMQAEAWVSNALDPHYSASILVSMANAIVHHWLVVGEDFDGEVLTRTLTHLWAGALGLPWEAASSEGKAADPA